MLCVKRVVCQQLRSLSMHRLRQAIEEVADRFDEDYREQ